jgi:hypothetical protein
LSTAAGTARGLRDRPLGRVAILLVVLVAAFLVSKSCGSSGGDVSKEEAIEIARGEIDYTPDRVGVRFVKQGLDDEAWAVSLVDDNAAGTPLRVTVVLLDTDTGEVQSVRRTRR